MAHSEYDGGRDPDTQLRLDGNQMLSIAMLST
jgi:hypothetical protein